MPLWVFITDNDAHTYLEVNIMNVSTMGFQKWTFWVCLFTIFHCRHCKMKLERSCNPKFALLASLFAIKTNMRVRNNWFWHVYGNTSCAKIVDDVTQTIFVTIFIGHDWQLSCILGFSLTSLRLLLKSNLLVTNSIRFPNIKNIYSEVNTVNLW